ncbi:(2Fe-2S)-binding protein [Streptomyces sp. NPDC006923]|uniref:(2Fe-2S)-binding protein n=1 Tax=Streptomyces sp. NPDC006923 TaxID=3155355 RepID=UPI0033D01247
MTDENPGSGPGASQGQGGWQPIPQGGEYDGESTAFVQLPPEDATDAPLAAPGHGYVPPQIVPLTPADPAPGDPPVAGGWAAGPPGPDGAHWPAAHQGPGQPGPGYDQGGYDPGQSGQWHYGESGETGAGTGPGPGDAGFGDGNGGAGGSSELTGQWTIPVAQGDLPDESGEYSTSMLATWNSGAPAPWATEPEPVPEEAPAPDDTTGRDTQDTLDDQDAQSSAGAPLPGDTSGGWDPEPTAPGPAGEPGVPGEADEADEANEPAAEGDAVPEPGPEPDPEPEPAPLTSSSDSAEHPSGSYVLRVNGADRPVTDAWIGESLLYVLRERLGLAGAKDGCSQGECGACNVQVDGRLVASCLVPAATAAGSEVRTVEGLAADGEPSDVQRALAKCGAVQCGFCIPGMAMTVHDLLEGNHAPSELETRQALCGNLCRCSGYRGVLDAVSEVVAERKASAEAAAAASEEARIPHQAPPGAGSAQPPHSPDGGMA